MHVSSLFHPDLQWARRKKKDKRRWGKQEQRETLEKKKIARVFRNATCTILMQFVRAEKRGCLNDIFFLMTPRVYCSKWLRKGAHQRLKHDPRQRSTSKIARTRAFSQASLTPRPQGSRKQCADMRLKFGNESCSNFGRQKSNRTPPLHPIPIRMRFTACLAHT